MPPHTVRPRRTRGHRLLAASVGLGVALAALELSLRLAFADGAFLGYPLPPYGALTNEHQRAWVENQLRLEHRERRAPAGDAVSSSGQFDAELGWTVGPGFVEGRVSANSWGARGGLEYAAEPAPDMLRLACFGDSFTWCAEVDDADTWQVALAELDPRIEAVNFGVGGYGTDQALLRFRRQGRRSADVVVIGIMLENIGRNVNRYRPLWYPAARASVAKPRFVLAEHELVLVPSPFATRAALCEAVLDGSVLEQVALHEHWLDRPAPGLARHLALARLALLLRSKAARQPSRLWSTPGEPLDVTLALLRRFHAEALASGARYAPIVVFPRAKDLDALEAAGAGYWEPALAELAAEEIPILDLAPALLAARRAEPGRELYRAGHLDRAGNAIVARELLAWLAAAAALPAR